MEMMRKTIEAKILDLADDWIGASSTLGLSDSVKTFDNHLYEVEIALLPFLVVNVKSWEKSEEEIGVPHSNKDYQVEIYYLDMDAAWNTGDAARTKLVGALIEQLELNPRLQGAEYVGTRTREYVWDTEINSATFDSSGQEGEYSFASIIYMTVRTATT